MAHSKQRIPTHSIVDTKQEVRVDAQKAVSREQSAAWCGCPLRKTVVPRQRERFGIIVDLSPNWLHVQKTHTKGSIQQHSRSGAGKKSVTNGTVQRVP